VHRAADEGDAEALAIIDEFAHWVALGLANLTNLTDPEAFVLGGGLAASADHFLAPIERWFSRVLYSATLRPHPRLAFAQLGARAGAVGAALLADVH
jgi:glucokinase